MSTMSVSAALMASAGAMFVLSSDVRAVIVPDAEAFVTVRVNNEESFESGTTSATDTLSSGGAFATGTASPDPAPNLSATVSASDDTSQALATLTYLYSFALDGPAGVSVPVTIDAFAWLSPAVSEFDQNFASLYFLDPEPVLLAEACAGAACDTTTATSSSFSVSESLLLQSMTIYSLQLTMSLTATGWWGTGTASGYIDPVITIAPSFTDEFSLLLSDGVGNSLAPVPIPGAFGLFASGLAAAGLLNWRRRSKQTRNRAAAA